MNRANDIIQVASIVNITLGDFETDDMDDELLSVHEQQLLFDDEYFNKIQEAEADELKVETTQRSETKLKKVPTPGFTWSRKVKPTEKATIVTSSISEFVDSSEYDTAESDPDTGSGNSESMDPSESKALSFFSNLQKKYGNNKKDDSEENSRWNFG